MKCMETNPLNDYMEGQLSQSESIQFEKHLESCKGCQLQLEHWINKHEDFEDSWEEQVTDETFMQNILDQLTPYTPSEETNPAEVMIDSPKLINWKQRSLDIMKKITIAAVGLAVVISLGTYVSPTFANYVKSFFNSTEQVDPGMKNAYNEGFVKPLGLKVTDQGITIEVKEVLADTMRIAIISEATDQDGNSVDLNQSRELQFIIKDVTGNPLIDRKMGGWRASKKGEQLMVEQALTDLITGGKQLPDEVTVELSWKKIGQTSGDWVLNIPIDMAKAKAVTKTVGINKQYISPQGLKISLKRIELAPSLTLLSLETQLTPELYQQKKEIIRLNGLTEQRKLGDPLLPFTLAHDIQDYTLAYELLDQQGQVVAAWDEVTGKNYNSKNTINYGLSSLGNDESGYKWWHAFAPLTEKPEKLMFKLRAIYSKELANFNIKMNLDSLNKEQIKTEYNGSKFTFSDFSLKDYEEESDINGQPIQRKGGVIQFQAELAKDIVGLNVWQARDENGKEYNVKLEKKSTVGEDRKVTLQGVLLINLLHQPQELTLSYHISEMENRDVSWEELIDLNPLPSTAFVNDSVEEKTAKEPQLEAEPQQLAQLEPESQQLMIPESQEQEEQQPVMPEPQDQEEQQLVKPEPQDQEKQQESARAQPEPQQVAQPQKTVTADDEAIKKSIEAHFRAKYMSLKDLKEKYKIDFIVHNAEKNKNGLYKMAFYDLKGQKELYVIDFIDLEVLEQFGTDTGSGKWHLVRLSDGLYVSIDSLKNNDLIE
ncbi:DUF4179 domain-containing protein [Paenibacillus radicis (ex Xue et al. 2023)]|uniref:Anti-sigma-W factor RsiW n=1 Tax=Paenibacillus radicis (ex Xue et al. 2023) TaxID=2972489 RepID=A0ABT1YJV0_9BACL|nr:DUF4179 domain-containing protein [Paenibacillus radicis (ex Xue et al. 2023)]MCR8632265.1 DUF4179 domain-containing protein [Paenibacillus radicis (ex Xue et al. 2023)]